MSLRVNWEIVDRRIESNKIFFRDFFKRILNPFKEFDTLEGNLDHPNSKYSFQHRMKLLEEKLSKLKEK